VLPLSVSAMSGNMVAACTGICSVCTSHSESITAVSRGIFKSPSESCTASGNLVSSLKVAGPDVLRSARSAVTCLSASDVQS